MKKERNAPLCDICGKAGVRRRRFSRSYGTGANLLVIENVPVMVCPNCGERYMTESTLHEIERIKVHRRSFASPRNVSVATFG